MLNTEACCKRCSVTFSFDRELFKWKRYCVACEPLVIKEREQSRRARRKTEKQELLGGIDLEHIAIRTHKRVGEMLGISGEAVRLIEHTALIKIRKALAFGLTKQQINNSLRTP
jgi:hypothetical protein